jgi:hypothetical protein
MSQNATGTAATAIQARATSVQPIVRYPISETRNATAPATSLPATSTAATAIIALGTASGLILQMEFAIVATAATSNHANMTEATAVSTKDF